VADIAERVKKFNIARRMDGTSTREILEWYPRGCEESKVDRVDDGLKNSEECVESSGCRLLKTDRNVRGLEKQRIVNGRK
jgi:hypothetical protein